jgi:hypothetical protein
MTAIEAGATASFRSTSTPAGTVVVLMSDGSPPHPPYPPAPPPAWQPPAWQPAPYGYGLPPQPPTPKPKHPGALVVAIVGSVALFLVGLGVAGWVTFGRSSGPSHPGDWDPRVDDIAQFVQTERGVLFDHPVYVDFLADDEFTADVTTSRADLSDEDRQALDQSASLLRALGLAQGDIDLLDKQNQLSGEGTAAYYDPESERVRVRGTDLTPEVRVTLAHELTHALQDQFVDLDKVESTLDADDVSRFRAVVEGDATNVEDAYAEKELTDSEYDQYLDQRKQSSDSADFSGIPPAMVAFFEAPYAIGPSFDRIVKEVRGSRGLNDTLRDPPVSDLQLLDPQVYLDDTSPENVDLADQPSGREILDEGEFGTLEWYIVLASRIDPKQALHAVDGWAGDRYVSYQGSSGSCVEARFRGKTAAATDQMRGALDDWLAFSRPGEADVSDVDERTLQFTSCDPGPDATSTLPEVSPDDLLAAPSARLAIAADLVDQLRLPLDDAWCVARGVVDELTTDELSSSELSADARRDVAGVMVSCGVQAN